MSNYSGNYRKEEHLQHVQPIVAQHNHTVLFDLQTLTGIQPPKPYDKWSTNNQLIMVNLPHLKSNKFYTQEKHGGGYTSKWLWPVIAESFSKEIKNSYEFQRAILKFRDLGGEFTAFHRYCEQMDNNSFFQDTLPRIIHLAFKLPSLIKTGIPILKHGLNHSISLSQEQIACLLANAFLCTYPEKRNQHDSCPDINFNRLFQSERYHVVEKIKCIVNYFDRVTKNMPTGVVTFIRRSVGRDHLPDWSKTNIPLSNTTLKIIDNGAIENERELLQVDFANKYMGGGVIGGGCVQEEIRFVICPELIISRLFTEFLKDNEALIIAGAEQFSDYTGYAETFKFAGNHRDNTSIEPDSKRRRCYIVAIDAINFSNPHTQYEKRFIKRELNKAYVGFYHPLKDSTPPGVATGNWGCGAFKGDPQLKSLIQLMVCAITKRPLHYFTFGNRTLSESLKDIYNYLKENNINTLQLWEYMNEYAYLNKYNDDLFTFIKRRVEAKASGQESFYKEQNDYEKNPQNFKLVEISTKTKQPETTPLSPQKGDQTYAQVVNKEFTNKTSKYSYTAADLKERSHRTPTSQYEGDNKKLLQPKITGFLNSQNNQTYGNSAGAPMEQSHYTSPSQYGTVNKTNFPNQINSCPNNLPDDDVLMQECENNTIANNQKSEESYNKPSNSYMSSDYSESENKSIKEIMKMYETADKNKAKQTSSSLGLHLGNLENDYSTTNGEYGNKSISTNQNKYVQQNSNITNEESASGSSVYFNRNQGNNNLNSGLNNKLRKKDKVEVDIHTEKAEEALTYEEWFLLNSR